ncbi:MAG TPA: carboxypeptidase-like regulatory domain-containing protein [Candidatus Acidoferrales bacterium]
MVWKVTSKLLALLVLGSAVLVLLCAALPTPVHDYVFSVTGVVKTKDDAPVQDAEVTLEVNGPVYEAVTLVRTVKRPTNSTGGFVFTYLSHKRGVKYTITVRKEGFESQTVSGSAPPAGNHVIRLKRAGGAGPTSRHE